MDLGNNIKASAGWAGATINTNTDTDSAIIVDMQGHDPRVMFAVHAGTITDGSYVLKVAESDNSDGSSATEVGTYQFQDTFAATEDDSVQKVAATTTKRYALLRITSTGTTSGGVFKSAVALRSPKDAPAS